jgi:ABC-type lipopolysaccharide export system ATPase subunit
MKLEDSSRPFVAVIIGAMAPPLSEQLQQFKIDPVVVKNLQGLADSLARCHIGAILTDGDVSKARKRLLGLIMKAIEKYVVLQEDTKI